MKNNSFIAHLGSFILPVTVMIVIPGIFVLLNPKLPPEWSVHFFNPPLQIVIAGILILLGLSLMIACVVLFIRRGKGTLAPWSPTEHLVIEGPYKFSRNPMITGVVIVLVGLAVLFGSFLIGGWALMFLTLNSIYFKWFEEPGLVERFGAEYEEYRRRVPMWLGRLKK